jgi:two-component SAPR family response regulator
MKILFLDDSHARWNLFNNVNPSAAANAHFADSFSRGVELLEKNEYDVAFLDHDLDISHRTGEDVVNYIVENNIPIKRVICHSMNPHGRKNMVTKLKSAGYDAYECPFAWVLSVSESIGEM